MQPVVLLAAIGQMMQLQQLELLHVQCEWPNAAAAYTALTASSALQVLKVQLDGWPAGIWQAVFRPQLQLPHLHNLMVRQNHAVHGPEVAAFSSTDISRLVGCWPGLQHLKLPLQPDVQVAALSQLTALSALNISTATESTVKSLPGLTGLQRLVIGVYPPCSPAALLPLTALQQLTYLDAGLVKDHGGSGAAFLSLRRQVSIRCSRLRVVLEHKQCFASNSGASPRTLPASQLSNQCLGTACTT